MPASTAAQPVIVIPRTAVAHAAQPFAIDFPPFEANAAVCIGLSIDWSRADALRDYALRHTLPDEHARAARFARPDDSLRNLLGRALLRAVAAHYGGMDPRRTIRVNTWGKPELDDCSVGCNISHAGDQLWIAAASSARVGLDIEMSGSGQEYREVAAGFHPEEIAALRRAPDARQATMRCRNRKEAVSKATGLGLSLPLREYAVDCGDARSHWLRVAPPQTVCSDWTTTDIPVGGNYVNTLAIVGRVARVEIVHISTSD